jgi:hypothetical protein
MVRRMDDLDCSILESIRYDGACIVHQVHSISKRRLVEIRDQPFGVDSARSLVVRRSSILVGPNALEFVVWSQAAEMLFAGLSQEH